MDRSSTFGTSSADMPDQSVAQATKFPALASGASASTASAPPSRPWPKMSGRASRAPFGTRQMKRSTWTLPGMRSISRRPPSLKREPGGQPGRFRKHGTVKVPSTRCTSGVSGATASTLNCGAAPWTFRSPSLRSPSSAKARLRMWSRRWERFCFVATVKSQAR